MVDAVMGWPEFGPAAKCLNKYWFCHYPRPRKVFYDNGSELLGYDFQELLDRSSIKGQPIKNLQANSLCWSITTETQGCTKCNGYLLSITECIGQKN